MSRSQYKLLDGSLKMRERISNKINKSNETSILKIWKRNFLVDESCLNKTLNVYNGHIFKALKITKGHIGRVIGEFVFTRKPHIYKKKNIKKKK